MEIIRNGLVIIKRGTASKKHREVAYLVTAYKWRVTPLSSSSSAAASWISITSKIIICNHLMKYYNVNWKSETCVLSSAVFCIFQFRRWIQFLISFSSSVKWWCDLGDIPGPFHPKVCGSKVIVHRGIGVWVTMCSSPPYCHWGWFFSVIGTRHLS